MSLAEMLFGSVSSLGLDGPPADPTTLLLNYGVLGIVFVLVLFGMLVTKGQYLREREISDGVLANNAKLADAAERMAQAWEAQARNRAGGSG